MIDALAEPFSEPIGQRALLETAIIGAACGPLGAWVLLYRQSYAAESIAHGMLPGLVIATLLGLPLGLGAVAGLVLAAVAISLAGRVGGITTDTAVAVAVTTLFGAGALLALSPEVPARLGELLFGNPLSVTWGEITVSALVAVAILLSLAILHRPLALSAFDRQSAPSLGASPISVELALLFVLATAVFVAVQALGNLLVVALIIAPAAAAVRLTRRLPSLLAVSAVLAIAGGVAGLYASYYLNTAAGASIALAAIAIYAASFALAPLTAAGAPPRRLPAMLALVSTGFATVATGCGSESTFTAEEFVSAANANGAGIVLREPLSTAEAGSGLYAISLSEGAGAPLSGSDPAHGAGSIKVASGSEEAIDEKERCEAAVSLVCFRAANVAVIFEGLTPGEITRLEAAIAAIGDPAEETGPVSTGPAGTSAEAPAPPAAPSEKARRLFKPGLLDAYLSSGADAGVDWTGIAAVDRAERGAAGPVPASERIPAIALQLQSLGAPEDYRTALRARGQGSSRFAEEVLALAASLRAKPDLSAVPAVRGGFEPPVSEGTIVAGYGSRYGLVHDGIDIEAPDGSEIHAAGAGIVSSVGFNSLRGNQTCVLHRLDPPVDGNASVQTCYGNQSHMEVESGDSVEAGELIGLVGCSGPCLRPHLHFRVLSDSGEAAPAVDPQPYLAEAFGPVPEAGQPLE